ncbi:MAG: hypothetical protein IJT91_07465 [Clostridia bacterium]|nr:hypothetical protein [Clostridia bacterium]
MKTKRLIDTKLIKKICIIAAAVLVIAGAVFLFFAKRNGISDGEARDILNDLLPKAERINDIVWGEGLPVVEGSSPLSSVSGAQYRAVRPDAEYTSVESLKAAILEVYSDGYFEDTIQYVAFEDVEPLTTDINGNTDMSTAVYARYIENGNGVFCADIMHPAFDTRARTPDVPSAHVKRVWFDRVFIEIDMTDSRTGDIEKLTLRLKKQPGGWRLDDPSY